MRTIALYIAAAFAATTATAEEYRQPSDLFGYLEPCSSQPTDPECVSRRLQHGLGGVLFTRSHVKSLANELAHPTTEQQRKAEELAGLSRAEIWEYFNLYLDQMAEADQSVPEFRAEFPVESLLVYEVFALTYKMMNDLAFAQWIRDIESGAHADYPDLNRKAMIAFQYEEVEEASREMSEIAAQIWRSLEVEPMTIILD